MGLVLFTESKSKNEGPGSTLRNSTWGCVRMCLPYTFLSTHSPKQGLDTLFLKQYPAEYGPEYSKNLLNQQLCLLSTRNVPAPGGLQAVECAPGRGLSHPPPASVGPCSAAALLALALLTSAPWARLRSKGNLPFIGSICSSSSTLHPYAAPWLLKTYFRWAAVPQNLQTDNPGMDV